MPLMDRREDRKPWGLIVALLIAATAGLLSLPLQVLTFRTIDAASRQDIEENRRLVEQVKALEEIGIRDVAEHREANQADHDCIVSLALLLADPARDRTKPVTLPDKCVAAPAATGVDPDE